MAHPFTTVRRYRQAGLLALATLITGPVAAQTLNLPAVTAQSLTGTYADLGSAGTAISTPDFDDSNSAAQSIGFSFTYGGTVFTQFVLNTNGYVKLGSTAPPAPYFPTSPLSVAGGPLKGPGTFLLVPFNTDLEAAASGGTEYRLAVTGTAPNRVCTIQWKNVSDKGRMGVATYVDKQLSSISFQLKLYETSNQVEFVYGPAVAAPTFTSPYYSYAHVGLKGAGAGQLQVLSVAKTGDTPWGASTFQDGTYPDYTNGFVFTGQPGTGGATAAVLPDAGRTYRFSPPVANDLAVRTLYSIEQLPAGQAFAYRAYVANAGTTSLSGQTATLTLTGANAQTATVAVPALAAGASTTVRFPGLLLSAAGTTTATVTLPADGNLTNNTLAATTTVGTGGYFSYVQTSVAPSGAAGYLQVPAASYTSAFAAKYKASTPYTLNVVRARLGSSSQNVGNTVYGFIADTTGQVLAQSAPYQMQAGDLNATHSFGLGTPVTVPAGNFLVGLAEVVPNAGSYPAPLAYQPEVPTRPGTYYQFGISTPSTPADITATDTPGYRYLLEAGYATPLATKVPALAGTLAVYPNPSASGLVTLEVRGAGTGPLAVEVHNALGQRVYTSQAQSDVAATLNLAGLATGIYFLQVRSGEATSGSKLVITR